MSVQGEYKRTPPNGAWDGKVEIKCGGHEVGPLKGWAEV